MNEFSFWIVESRVERKKERRKRKNKRKKAYIVLSFKSVYKGGNGISLLPEIGLV